MKIAVVAQMQSEASNGLQRWPEPVNLEHKGKTNTIELKMASKMLFSVISHHSSLEKCTYCEVVCR